MKMVFLFSFATLAFLTSIALAGNPTVYIRNGTVTGSSYDDIDTFWGIPYAKPPVDELRLRRPRSIDQPFGTLHATSIPTACPQMVVSTTGAQAAAAPPEGEDCLTINVQRPSNIPQRGKALLPVMFFIYGGGFQVSSTQTYNASAIIKASQALGEDIIFVAANYRGNGFGFLGGCEVQRDGAANLGLRDQRLALEWVAENIQAFGGDPAQVTIVGESAGSISVYHHLLINGGDHTYRGKPLFRGAIMDSGSYFLVSKIDAPKAQHIYDAVVAAAGCQNTTDTLSCLRNLPYTTLKSAFSSVPNYTSFRGTLDLSYLPRPDPTNEFYSDYPEVSTARGRFARVPAIIGDQEDEGTTFAAPLTNITTTNRLVDYLTPIFPHASKAELRRLVDTYPSDPASGSPFGTGSQNQEYPQFKRNAALLGDLKFTLIRRMVLETTRRVDCRLPWWSYLATYGYETANTGTAHGSDLLELFASYPSPEAGFAIATYYISFVNHLDPNAIHSSPQLPYWPAWTIGKPNLLNISKSENHGLEDTFRDESYRFIQSHTAQLRL